ncbi:MAG: hypothetical protein JWL83_4306, partial [Actinomycetia bacterium]|nr:hypothetical protein [Actinomycetes bacterium]
LVALTFQGEHANTDDERIYAGSADVGDTFDASQHTIEITHRYRYESAIEHARRDGVDASTYLARRRTIREIVRAYAYERIARHLVETAQWDRVRALKHLEQARAHWNQAARHAGPSRRTKIERHIVRLENASDENLEAVVSALQQPFLIEKAMGTLSPPP